MPTSLIVKELALKAEEVLQHDDLSSILGR
jgi:hypothetical protein